MAVFNYQDISNIGGYWSYPFAINDSGKIAGITSNGSYEVSFTYSPGNYSTIGPFAYYSYYYSGYYGSYWYTNSYTESYGINNAGQLSGLYLNGNGYTQGFIYNPANGGLTNINYGNNTSSTYVFGNNDAGQVVGYGNSNSGQFDSFIYSNGTFVTLPKASSTYVYAQDINNNGQVTGYLTDNTGEHAFIYSGGASGTYTLLPTVPGLNSNTNIYARGINDAGQVVGYYYDSYGHAFLYTGGTNGRYIEIKPTASTYYAEAWGINNNGQVTGYYADSTGGHTFLLTINTPKVSAIADTPAGVAKLGTTVTLTVSMSEAVTVQGVPTLKLNDGGTAIYDAAATAALNDPTKLAFRYVVSNLDSDVASLSVVSVNLPPGAWIRGASVIDANLSLTGISQSGPQVDASAPKITSIVQTPPNGTVALNQTVKITLAASEAVNVSGTPTLTLNDGGTATYDAAATLALNDPTKLVFSYTVHQGDTPVPALAVQSINLPGNATIQDVSGNAALLSIAGVKQLGPAIDVSAVNLLSIVMSPATGNFNAGDAITITLATNGNVVITGSPTLALNDGGTATYDAVNSTATSLVFHYEVGGSDTSVNALAVTGVSLPSGATILDSFGNSANLSLLGLGQAGPRIDTVAPSLTEFNTSPLLGALGIGNSVIFTLKLSEAVTVSGGTPSLLLNDGGSAVLTSHSGNTLTFTYTVGSGDTSKSTLAVTEVKLNGAVIQDNAGNDANVSQAVLSLDGLSVDTVVPAIQTVTATTDSGQSILNAGHVVTVKLTAGEELFTTGTPALQLNNNHTATYVGGSGTNTLTFQYTVGQGDASPDLHITGLDLSNGAIRDGAGNALTGSAAKDLDLVIDTAAPTAASVGASTDNGATSLNAGRVVTITVGTNETVFVSGTPTLTLNDGRSASYLSGSGSNTLTFRYIVQPGDSTPNLQVTGLNVGAGSILDAAGNALGNVTGSLGLSIDTTTPGITGVTATTDNHSTNLNAGHVVTIDVAISQVVFVSGSGYPYLQLDNGATAIYIGGSTSNVLSFAYTVQPNDTSPDLHVTGLVLGNSTIAGASGTALAGSVATDLNLRVDTTAPTLSNITFSTDNNAANLNAGHVVRVVLHTTEPSIVDTAGGTPTLSLSNGLVAKYTTGSGTNALTFTYVVQPGDNDPDLHITGLNLNGATIRDAATNSFTGSVGADLDLVIDTTTAATTLNAVTDNGSANLNAGHVVTVTLKSNEVLTVTGTPKLQLNNGATATYTGGSGTTTLTFSYTVGSSDSIADLMVTGLVNNGATIQDPAANPVTSVTADLAIKIDTVAPTGSVVATTDNGASAINAGHVVTIKLTANEPLTVNTSGGSPRLALSNGLMATYQGGSGTDTLTFRYTVQGGDNVASLAVSGLDLNGSTVRDGAGNAINAVSGNLSIKIDTAAPTTASVNAVADNNQVKVSAGHQIAITVHTSEVVTVDTSRGVPSLTLTGGEIATYVSGSGTNALTFNYLVEPGDSVASLQVTGLSANGGSIKDSAGNALGAVSGNLGLQVDGIIPKVTSTSVSASTVVPGQTLSITLNLNNGVTVSGGVPKLVLNGGGIATYDPTATAALNDPAKLVFKYTVSLSDRSTAALAVSDVNLDGATIVSAAGNVANLASVELLSLGVAVDTKLTWVSGATGAWSNAAKWNAGIVPGANNDAYVGGTGNDTVYVNGNAAAYNVTINNPHSTLYVGSQLTLGGRLDVASGAIIMGVDPSGVSSGLGTIIAPGGVHLSSGTAMIVQSLSTVKGGLENNSAGLPDVTGSLGYAGLLVRGYMRIAGDLTGSGTTSLYGMMQVDGAVTQNFVFEPGFGDMLRVGDPTHFSGSVAGFSNGGYLGLTNRLVLPADTIDFVGFDAVSHTYVGNTLTLTNAGGQSVHVNITGQTSTELKDATLVVEDDGSGGTYVYWRAGLDQTWDGTTGSWTDGAHWASGVAPGKFDNVTFGGSGAYTVHIEDGDEAQGNLLTVTNSDAVFDIENANLTLGYTPVLAGNQIHIDSGSLNLIGSTTLDNATVVLAGGRIVGVDANPYYIGALLGTTLTLGPDLVIQNATSDGFGSNVIAAPGVVNEGAIVANAGDSGMSIQATVYSPSGMPSPGTVTNKGSISVGNGDSVYIGDIFDNTAAGVVTVGDDSTAYLGTYQLFNSGSIVIGENAAVGAGTGSWSNTGSIVVGAGSELSLFGTFSAASLSNIVYDGATVILGGAPTDNGTNLLHTPGGNVTQGGGAVPGVVITANGGTLIYDPSVPLMTPNGFGYQFYSLSEAKFAINSGATLEFRGDVQNGYVTSGTVTFNGAGATLRIGQLGLLQLDPGGGGSPPTGPLVPGDFWGALNGLEAGDVIEVGTTVSQLSFDQGLTIFGNDGSGSFFSLDQQMWADKVTVLNQSGTSRLVFHADTIAPAVTSIDVQTDNDATTLNAGHMVTLVLHLRETVTVTDQPQLVLSNGGTAFFAGGSGTDTLIFGYQVGPGQSIADLKIARFDFTNGSIADLGGNNLAGAFNADLGLTIDTDAPIVSKVITSPERGIEHTGQTTAITLRLNEAVTIQANGVAPRLLLSNGGMAEYDATATAALNDPTKLVFSYTVKLSDNSAAVLSIDDIQINSAIVRDAAGNDVDFSAIIGKALVIQVDTSPTGYAPAPSKDLYFITDTGSGFQVFKTSGASSPPVAVGVSGGGYSNPQFLVTTSDATYFVATDSNTSMTALWKIGSNGSAAPVDGTQGIGVSQASYTAAVGNQLFIWSVVQSMDPWSGQTTTTTQLLATDGTTTSVAASWSDMGGMGGSPPMTPPNLTAGGDRAYFMFADPWNPGGQAVLWRSDGTMGGTQQVTLDVPSDPMGGGGWQPPPFVTQLISATDGVYVVASVNGISGIYKAGDTGNASWVADAYPTMPTAFGNYLFYFYGVGLVATDGTPGGTVSVGSFDNPTLMVAGTDRVFFVANNSTGQQSIWSTTGSAASTVLFADAAGKFANPSSMVQVGGNLYFTAADSNGINRLWRSDGTSTNTAVVTSSTGDLLDPMNLISAGGKLLFIAYDEAYGSELWQTDGTTAGTALVRDLAQGSMANSATNPNDIETIGGKAFFLGFDADQNRNVVWSTDGTPAGTSILGPGYAASSLFSHNGQLYFSTNNPVTGQWTFWKSDGTANGTTAAFTAYQPFVAERVFNGNLYLSSNGATFKWDFSNSAPTIMTLADGSTALPAPTGGGSAIAGSKLFIYSYSSVYATDGTPDGTVLAANQGASAGVAIGNNFYFMNFSTGLWKSDGTPAGTTQLTSTVGGNLTVVGSRLYFSQFSSPNSGLWTSDGTVGGTHEVNPAGQPFFAPQSYEALGSTAYFIALSTSTGRYELWKSDGTNAGTTRVSAANVPSIQSNGDSLYLANGKLYFWTNDNGNATLWQSNGTTAGTSQVATIAGNGWPVQAYGSSVLFGVGDQTHGLTIWRSDGTQAGTVPLVDDVVARSAYIQSSATAAVATPVTPVSGQVIDGYIAGATVFDDANNDGIWEPGETETITDAHGAFSLQGGLGTMVMIGGVDTATHLPFNGKFLAPNGYTVITPVTTLVSLLLPGNPSASDVTGAEQNVLAAFGITLESGQSLASLDPIVGTYAGSAAAAALFVSGIAVQNTVAMLSAALAARGSGDEAAAFDAVFAAIASQIAAHPGDPLDLTDRATIAGLLNAAASVFNPGATDPLSATLVDKVAEIVTASNSKLYEQVQAASDPLEILRTASASGLVAQGQTADDLGSGSPIELLVARYTGQALSQSVNDASNDVTTPCYCRGTLILTDRGEVPVEELAIGDSVVTMSSAVRAIKWIGRRSYHGRFALGKKHILPIRFTAGSLADRVPRRDLWVSPHHAMYLDGILVEARDLVNDISIVQAKTVEQVEYFHIELETHDVIVAEGAWSETFVDDDSRRMFHNAHEYFALYGEDTEPARYCAPRQDHGYQVETVRRELMLRAHLAEPSQAAMPVSLRGYVDRADSQLIEGWAQDLAYRDLPVCLDICVGGRVIGQVLANRYREDLLLAGVGSGCHSFSFTPPAGLTFEGRDVEVRRSIDGARLVWSWDALQKPAARTTAPRRGPRRYGGATGTGKRLRRRG